MDGVRRQADAPMDGLLSDGGGIERGAAIPPTDSELR